MEEHSGTVLRPEVPGADPLLLLPGRQAWAAWLTPLCCTSSPVTGGIYVQSTYLPGCEDSLSLVT